MTEIIGVRLGGEPADEADHFYTCDECGEAVDMRRLGDVFHHEDAGHARLIQPS